VDHTDEVHGQMTVPGVVPKLSETPGGIRQAARWTVGADTEAVLEELGVDAAERERLAADGII
jgi:formyl-CoA transferase